MSDYQHELTHARRRAIWRQLAAWKRRNAGRPEIRLPVVERSGVRWDWLIAALLGAILGVADLALWWGSAYSNPPGKPGFPSDATILSWQPAPAGYPVCTHRGGQP